MPSVILACNALGVGGTERGMTTQALALDRTRFDVRVLGERPEASGLAPVDRRLRPQAPVRGVDVAEVEVRIVQGVAGQDHDLSSH